MTLVRYLQSVGLLPLPQQYQRHGRLLPHPDTQQSFAKQHDQDVRKVTSFADSTTLDGDYGACECHRLRAGKRGMYGYPTAYVRDLARLLPPEQMLNGGLVDYSVGANPYTGAWVRCTKIIHISSANLPITN